MKDYLVIVESPHKAKTIQQYLGKDYLVVASVGHIRDLAVGNTTNSLGVDIQNDFSPIYEISTNKKKTVNTLKKLASEYKEVILATDPDREGEAISWHLAEVLNLDVKTAKRVEYHELTYNAIKEAFSKPRLIDMNLVSSQETRRILDRIIGFRLSQLLQQKIGSKSAGRVQSVVLKLVVDKQKEINAFNEETYYKILGTIKINDEEVSVTLVDEKKNEIHFKTLEEANEKITSLKNQELVVKEVINEEKTRSSKPVYTTSTMQQDAANLLKFDSKKTMKVAQTLYEGVDLGSGSVGLITYMRTDSVRIAPNFINKTKEHIASIYGPEYVGVAKVFNNKSENVQDAHEGVRPTDLSITPEMVEQKASKDQAKLYKLIYTRAVASIMKEERYLHQEIILENNHDYFKATGDLRLFDGFTKELKEFDKVERKPLPQNIKVDEITKITKLVTKDGQTKGPIPYTEASLIATMEKDGIGRPSTYASTLDLIKARNYVIISKNHYEPTKQGELTVAKLDESFSSIINIDYTANMETKLDEIALGHCGRVEALKDFYNEFETLYDKAKKEMTKEVVYEDLGTCPQCGKPLVRRNSKYGSFIACSGYPNCKYIDNSSNDNKVGTVCPKCHEGKLVLRNSKYGKFYACDRYPACDYHENAKGSR